MHALKLSLEHVGSFLLGAAPLVSIFHAWEFLSLDNSLILLGSTPFLENPYPVFSQFKSFLVPPLRIPPLRAFDPFEVV